jgi:hypothetical protein
VRSLAGLRDGGTSPVCQETVERGLHGSCEAKIGGQVAAEDRRQGQQRRRKPARDWTGVVGESAQPRREGIAQLDRPSLLVSAARRRR